MIRSYNSHNYTTTNDMPNDVFDTDAEGRLINDSGCDIMQCIQYEHEVGRFNNHRDNDGKRGVHWDLTCAGEYCMFRAYIQWPDEEGLVWIDKVHTYEGIGYPSDACSVLKTLVSESMDKWEAEKSVVI